MTTAPQISIRNILMDSGCHKKRVKLFVQFSLSREYYDVKSVVKTQKLKFNLSSNLNIAFIHTFVLQ